MKLFLSFLLLFTFNSSLFSQVSPHDIQGLELWYSADSVNNSTGTQIDTIYDLSSNQNHLSQNNSSNQPSFVSTSSINKPVIHFDGANRYMESIFNQTISQPYTLFLVYPKTNPFSFIVTLSVFNGSTSELYENNILMSQGNVGTNNLPGLTMGKRINFDDRYFIGDFSQLLIYEGELSTAQIDSVNSYLYDFYTSFVDLGPDLSLYGFCDTTLSAGSRFESYLWSTGDVTEEITVSSSGTYWVEATDVFGFTSTDTIVVSFAEPEIPTIPVYCPGDNITWNTNLGSDYSYLWSTGETTESISINTEDDYDVTITDTNGCVYTSPTLAFIEDTMQATISLGPDLQLCAGNQIELINTVPNIVDYNWSTGETTSSIEVNTTDEYILEVTNSAGCVAEDTINVEIIGVAPNMEIEFPLVQCVGAPNNYNDLSVTLDGSNIDSWQWSFGNGDVSADQSGTHTYTSPGMFEVTLEVDTDASCGNTITRMIEVKENPILDFSTSGSCQEALINFNGGQLTPTTINTWQWSFDDPASGINNSGSGQNTTHIFESSGGYDVELIGTDINGCIDTVIQSITIDPTPQVDFAFDEVCVGSIVEFENLSTIEPPGTIINYNWSFGDATFSGQTEPQKLYSNFGTFSVTLNATGNNGCSGQLTLPLKVHAFPLVDQVINSSCAGITSEFGDNSFVPNGSIAEVYWSLNGDNPINAFNIEPIFENSGNQTIQQTVVSSFGCSSTDTYTIQVDDYIHADFEIEPSVILAGYPTSFNNLSVGALSNEWTFDNLGSSNDVSPSFVFPESSVGDEVTVELKIENSFACRDSVSLTLPVLSSRTDLAISQLFLQEDNGFYVVGVELENKGTTPITSSDLFLRTPSVDVLKEVWEGELQAGDKEIHIFSASPSMTVPQENIDQNAICVEGLIRTPNEFEDEDLSNNEVCEAISESSTILLIPHPNPVANELTIQLVLPFDEVGTLEVYNSQGQLVALVKENESFKKGLNSVKINTEQWQSGNYSIVYNGKEEQQIAKVIKL